MATIIDTIKYRYKTGSVLTKIIFINIGVFLALRIGAIVCTFGGWDVDGNMLQWIELPSSPVILLSRPWAIITYMFSQFDILHILFNMLWLYWFGTVFLFTGNTRQMFALYLYGGIFGALAFMCAYNLFPYFEGTNGWLIGSSASVIAIVAATAMLHPDYKMSLLFIGEISLKWIAVATIAIDFLSITDSNAGGHIAHIGGAVIGVIYGTMLNRGTDITRPFNMMLDKAVNTWNTIIYKIKQTQSNKAKPKTGTRYNSKQSTTDNDRVVLDSILDKIKKSGYASLSVEEKKTLFDVSRRVK